MRVCITSKKTLLLDGRVFFNCIIGKNGISKEKIEGDWKTPAGIWKMRKVFYRPDRVNLFSSALELVPITKDMFWCDDPLSVFYNKLVNAPFTESHENLWREDELYDIVVETDFNTDPITPNKGSAIFIHVAKPNMQYTKGCVALEKDDLIQLLGLVDTNTEVEFLAEA